MMNFRNRLLEETIQEYGTITEMLDEVVWLCSKRVIARTDFGLEEIKRRSASNPEKTYHYFSAASFIAQRGCHNAQANALLLRHGFADQAFELWRTLYNLFLVLYEMSLGEKEKKAARFLDSMAIEFANIQFGRDGHDEDLEVWKEAIDVKEKILTDLKGLHGERIVKRDGWTETSWDTKGLAHRAGVEDDYHLYQLASKLVHGTPLSVMQRADWLYNAIPNPPPLAHDIGGVPYQILLTGDYAHRITDFYCTSTELRRPEGDDDWRNEVKGILHNLRYQCLNLALSKPKH